MRDMIVTSLPVHTRIAASLRWASLFAVLVGLCCGQSVFGQPGGAHGGAPIPVGPGMRGPMGGPGGSGGPGAAPGVRIPGQANPNGPKGPSTELKIDSETLPDNFAPPAAKAEVMELDQPLAMKDEIDKLKKDLAKYQQVLRTAKPGDAEKALIKNGLRYRLALMCLKQNRMELSKLHDDLTRELASAASAPETPNANAVRTFRQMVLQELVNQITPLLTTQPFHVRLHLVLLLSELNLTEETSKFALKQESFGPAITPLLQVISSPDQPEGVKIVAANGLARNVRLGTANVTIRAQVASALVAELQNKKAHPWYQMRLASALSAVDVDLVQGKPIIVDVLRAVMADSKRTWGVRAEAAKSLGRVPLPAVSNPASVTRDVAAFSLELAKAAQQAPATKADETKWKSEFFKVYLAFQQLDASDLQADRKTKAGLLNNPQAMAKPAYDLIVPLVAAILHGQRLTVQQVQSLVDYVKPAAAVQQPAQNDQPTEKGGKKF